MKRPLILVVEDDPDIRESLLDLLQENACDAVGAANGAEALRHLEGSLSLPCIILLDLMMPVMDGIAFRAAQLSKPALAGIPVVVLSAYRDIETHADELQAAAYVKKPPEATELIGLIRRHC